MPVFTLTITPPKALELLTADFVHVIYLDASLSATKDNSFQLITLMVAVGGIFIPAAWFITDTRQDIVYSSFFRSILVFKFIK
jgi:hypothetical protein